MFTGQFEVKKIMEVDLFILEAYDNFPPSLKIILYYKMMILCINSLDFIVEKIFLSTKF